MSYRSRLNFSDEDLNWSFISSKFNLYLSFWLFFDFSFFIGRVARYTPSSRPKNTSKIKANLEIHKSSDDFILKITFLHRIPTSTYRITINHN